MDRVDHMEFDVLSGEARGWRVCHGVVECDKVLFARGREWVLRDWSEDRLGEGPGWGWLYVHRCLREGVDVHIHLRGPAGRDTARQNRG